MILSGAGISVASGLADYRGSNGTYTLNKTYRPIYYNEFCASHEARKRYWARSFLGWTNLNKSRPNKTHYAVKTLGELGRVGKVITQSKLTRAPKYRFPPLLTHQADVDSFHTQADPELPIIELHGYLRALVCITCRSEYPRAEFQRQLAELNPSWAHFLEEMLLTGALDTEDPDERKKRGYRTNPDGDVEVPDAPYTTFRYPPCPVCLKTPPKLPSGDKAKVEVDHDGAWKESNDAGILKPAVIMFGESIPDAVKSAAENAIDEASRLLVLGTSLATYSAFRLAKRAKDNGMPIAVLNLGGIRGEDELFAGVGGENKGQKGARCSQSTEIVLPSVVDMLKKLH